MNAALKASEIEDSLSVESNRWQILYRFGGIMLLGWLIVLVFPNYIA